MLKNYKQVMRGKGGRRTQQLADSASTSMSIPNTKFRGKHRNKHIDRPKQDDDVTDRRSLLNKLQRKLFTKKIVQKDRGPAYTPLIYYHGLGWYKKNVISTYNVLH